MAKRRAYSVVFSLTPKLEAKVWRIAIITKRSPVGVVVDLTRLMLRVCKDDPRVLRLLPQALDRTGGLWLVNLSGGDFRLLGQKAKACGLEVDEFLRRLVWVGCDFYERAASRRKSWQFNKEEMFKEFLLEIVMIFRKSA